MVDGSGRATKAMALVWLACSADAPVNGAPVERLGASATNANDTGRSCDCNRRKPVQ